MTAFRMYLRVVSTTLQPAEITRKLGVAPDESAPIGSRRRPETPPRKHATWIRWAGAVGAEVRPEDLEPVILGWGEGFAQALGELTSTGDAAISLEIVQQIRDLDSSKEKGIFLSAELMAWLAIAGASLDIDQYIYHECFENPDDANLE